MKPSATKTSLLGGAHLLACFLLSPYAGAQEAPHAETPGLELDLRPYVAWAYAPHSLTVGFPGADVGLRLGRFVEVALDGAWYAPFNPGVPDFATTPVNEDRFSTDLDLVLYPLATLTRGPERAGALEPYVVGGVGVMVDRPVAVVDPMNRHFGDDRQVDLVAGGGARMFLTRWLALGLDVRGLVYSDRRENPAVAGTNPGPPGGPSNESTWYDPRSYLTCDLQVRLGVSFVLDGR